LTYFVQIKKKFSKSFKITGKINVGANGNNNEMHGETSSIGTPIASSFSQKRTIDQIEGRQSQMKSKRSMHDASDSDMNDSIDNMNNDDIFLPAAMQPQVTINESPRYDTPTTVVKSEGVANSRPQSPMYRNTYSKGTFTLNYVICRKFSFILTGNSNALQNNLFPYYGDYSTNDLSINNNSGSSSNNGSVDMSKSHMEVPPGKHFK
jgi:hypothetical protein